MDHKNSLRRDTISGVIWSFAERILAQLVSFIVSVILARLLLPNEYGIISIVTVIISICNVFITSGFSASLIQKKDADDIDFSSVFYFGVIFSGILYAGVFLSAPLVASFYQYKQLDSVIRVMGISLVVSAFKSVQHSKISRDMQFKKFFWSTFFGTVVSAVVGIIMAYCGFGVWALVGQYLSNNIIDTFVLWCTVKWRPKKVFSFSKLKVLISFGWKLLATNLLLTIYSDLRTLIIGKVYTSDDLAYYNKGKQFPSLIVTNVNSSISSALLPSMSKMQDDLTAIRSSMRRFIKTGSYILMPVMVGLAVVAEPLVRVLLTDKWIAVVPYLQLLCIEYATLSLQTANVQAVIAVGRSDISLKTEIIKRGSNIVIILLTFRISVFAMVVGEVVSSVVSLIINTLVSKKLFGYGPLRQIADMLPNILISLVMGFCVHFIGMLPMPDIVILIVQSLCGIVLYILLSMILKIESFKYIINASKPVFLKFFRREKDIET